MSYIAKTTSKGHDYYKVMESYRENGRIKHRVILNIGTLQNLFSLLPEHIQKGSAVAAADFSADYAGMKVTIEPVRCRCHGTPYLIWSVAEWLGIEEMMNKCFKHGTDHEMKEMAEDLTEFSVSVRYPKEIQVDDYITRRALEKMDFFVKWAKEAIEM